MEPAREPTERAYEGAGEIPEVELEVSASERARTGCYANFAQVSHDGDGFTIDFFATDPDDPPSTAILQARVRMGHRMTMRLRDTLTLNIMNWASKEQAAREEEAGLLQELSEQARALFSGEEASDD